MSPSPTGRGMIRVRPAEMAAAMAAVSGAGAASPRTASTRARAAGVAAIRARISIGVMSPPHRGQHVLVGEAPLEGRRGRAGGGARAAGEQRLQAVGVALLGGHEGGLERGLGAGQIVDGGAHRRVGGVEGLPAQIKQGVALTHRQGIHLSRTADDGGAREFRGEAGAPHHVSGGGRRGIGGDDLVGRVRLSQYFQSRKKVIFLFMIMSFLFTLVYLLVPFRNSTWFYIVVAC